jgi:hypothetical protein
MVNKNLMSQALKLVNQTTSPNVLAQRSEEASDLQELSEEALSQVWGAGVPPDPYAVPVPPLPHNPPGD